MTIDSGLRRQQTVENARRTPPPTMAVELAKLAD